MSPTPKREPMITCPHCGTQNDPARGSNRCRNCQLPLGAYVAAVAGAAQILANVRARLATIPPRQAAEEAYVPGGPSVDELEARIRALRDRARPAARAA